MKRAALLLDAAQLKPGDLLVFSRKGLFDSIIRLKTWSAATHVEVYVAYGATVASRNGKGVAVYPLDLDGLYAALRPQKPFDLKAAMAAFWLRMNGKPYGWLALLSFCLIDLHDRGIFCSELATMFYRAGGFDPFNARILAEVVAPGDMLYFHASVMSFVYERDPKRPAPDNTK